MVKYLLECSNENSCTWSQHLRMISSQYGLEEPLNLLKRDPISKSSYKSDISVRIKAFHEQELRCQNINNEKLKYLNISVMGLSGRHHAAPSGLLTVMDVRKSRPHLKMLVGDFYTYEMKSE